MTGEKDTGETVANWGAVESYINAADPDSLQLTAMFDLLRLRLLEQEIVSAKKMVPKRAKGSASAEIVIHYKIALLTQLGEQVQERLRGEPGYKTEMGKAYDLLEKSGLKPGNGVIGPEKKDLPGLLNLARGRLKSDDRSFDLGF